MAAAVMLLCLALYAGLSTADVTHTVRETEMFSLPITPNMFNWTYQVFDQQYRFHTSLLGAAELPPWLRYVYSGRHHSGFVYGTPPRGISAPVTLEVVGLNREDYETRRLRLTLAVEPREPPTLARHEIQLKIDNLNVEDLLDQHRMKDLKDIFSRELWRESDGQLYPTFLASAIDLGARLPLKPNEGEGVVVRLGSPRPFSSELRRLREEVRPLSRLASCPRDYKRTTVERLFRTTAFTLDWCSFKLFDTTYSETSAELSEVLDDSSTNKIQSPDLPRWDRSPDLPAWTSPRIDGLPSRSYLREFTVAVAVPLLLMLVSVGALTAVLCFHYVGVPDEGTEYFFDNIFHLCEETHRRAQNGGRAESCRYVGGGGGGDTEQTHLGDTASDKSLSPDNSHARPYSPKSVTNLAGSYNRPRPPPYAGSGTNTLLPRTPAPERSPSSSGHSPDRRTLALEESLQLLNEANIASVDYIDGLNLRNERVVPILKQPIEDETEGCVPLSDGKGYVRMQADLGYVAMESERVGHDQNAAI